jgi:hypothetical protein
VFYLNTRYNSSIVYVDLRVARILKIVLNITEYKGEIEELEISKLLELFALLSSHSTKILEENRVYY